MRKKLNNHNYFHVHPNQVFKLVKKYYPKLCTCFEGKIALSNYNKLLNKLSTYLDKSNYDYRAITSNKKIMQYKDKFSYHQFIIPILSKEEIYVGQRENIMGISIYNTKEKFKSSINFLNELKNEKRFSEKEKKLIERLIEVHKQELPDAKKNKCYIFLDIRNRPTKKITKKSLEYGDFLKHSIVENIFQIIDEYNIKGKGSTCNIFEFDSKKYTLVGNIDLPIDVLKALDLQDSKIAKGIINRMGKPKLSGVGFDITDSPLGLVEINIYYDEDKYYIGSKIEYKAKKMKNLVINNYLVVQPFTKMIMEDKKC